MSKPSEINLGELRQALVSARVAADDLDFVTEDLMRPHRERVWGYVTHAEKHAEARGSLLKALGFALRMLGVEPPGGDGGAEPAGGGEEPRH